MKSRKYLKILTFSTIVLLFINCGGNDKSSSDTQRTTNKENPQSSNSSNQSNNKTQNQESNQNNANNTNNTNNTNNQNQDKLVASYEKNSNTLIETLSNGTKRVWINSRSNACLIYRIKDRGGNIADGGKAHCESLSQQAYEGITNWRMPTPDEASFFMKNVDIDKIVYPDDNPYCLFMATSDSKDSLGSKFVYTTNNSSDKVGDIFSDPNRKTAGVRCVADQ